MEVNMSEVWKDIEQFPGYSISSEGRVRNNKTGHIRTFNPRPDTRYAKLTVRVNGEAKRSSVHRLVANAFIPNPENKPEINHINGDKFDNRKENLEWCTHSENMIHAVANGICPKPPPKSTQIAVFNADDTECLAVYDSIKEASEDLGISLNTIYCTLCQRNHNPVHNRIFYKIGRDVSLTTSQKT